MRGEGKGCVEMQGKGEKLLVAKEEDENNVGKVYVIWKVKRTMNEWNERDEKRRKYGQVRGERTRRKGAVKERIRETEKYNK